MGEQAGWSGLVPQGIVTDRNGKGQGIDLICTLFCDVCEHIIPDFKGCLFLTGITRFDLLGDFGRFNWLGNFYIVLSYNLLFAVVTTLCLVRKFTSAVREELLKALGNPPALRGFSLPTNS